MKNRYRVWGLVSFFSLTVSVADAAPPPISAFARLEQITDVRLTPDGKYLAFISQSQGRRVAMTMDLTSPGSVVRPVLTNDKEGNFDLTWCRWAKNTRLLCGYIAPIEYMGKVYRISRMVAVNADGSDMKVLLQNSPVVSDSPEQDAIIDSLPDKPNTVLIQAPENLQQNAGSLFVGQTPKFLPAIFELDIYNGRLNKYLSAHSSIRRYVSDGHGNVRLGVGYEGTKSVYFARLESDKQWRQLAKVEAYEPANAYVPQSIISGTNKAYAIGPSGDRKALWKIDLEDKEKPELIFEHPQVDVTRAIRDRDGDLIGVFYETDRPFFYYTDPKIAAFMEGVKKALPNSFVSIVSATTDRRRAVIVTTSDADAGTYYLLDTSSGQMTRLGTAYPELDRMQASLPRMRFIEYKLSDGTTIPGYLTTPVGIRAEKLPLIVMPHGGPIARDHWNFDFLRVFLASRGYAVLQMNYRGSDGYGTKWFRDAFQDWGGMTHSDITGAARWAIAQGIADPKRMCIVGWSFGGYAALLGAARDSDLYKCSASIAGVSNLKTFEQYWGWGIGGQLWRKQLGTDSDKLKEESPQEHVTDINIPVLMIHGTLDAQVPYAQSEEMADALKKAGKNYKFVIIKNADRNLWRESERTTLLTELEQFLQTNLGPGATASN